MRMATATAHPGVNSNFLSDESGVDVPSGNAVLNGIPVQVEAARDGQREGLSTHA